MKKNTYIFISLLFCSFLTKAQTNLVPNPSFELYDTCPLGGGPINYSIPWYNPTGGTPDYFNHCSNTSESVPSNSWGFQYSHTGVGYSGIFTYQIDIPTQQPYREYLQVQLIDTLKPTKKYCISLFVNLADNTTQHFAYKQIAITELGIYFSNNPVTSTNFLPLQYIPQVKSDSGVYLTDTTNWMQIIGTYTALGGEKYITIGNFKGNNTDTLTIANNINDAVAYYYIDDVSIIDCDSLGIGISEFQVSNFKFQISPNPSKGIFNINLGKHYRNIEIDITDMFGKKVIHQEKKNNSAISIDISNNPSGLYFATIIADDKRQVLKLVKE